MCFAQSDLELGRKNKSTEKTPATFLSFKFSQITSSFLLIFTHLSAKHMLCSQSNGFYLLCGFAQAKIHTSSFAVECRCCQCHSSREKQNKLKSSLTSFTRHHSTFLFPSSWRDLKTSGRDRLIAQVGAPSELRHWYRCWSCREILCRNRKAAAEASKASKGIKGIW